MSLPSLLKLKELNEMYITSASEVLCFPLVKKERQLLIGRHSDCLSCFPPVYIFSENKSLVNGNVLWS